jgi:hypothetical protein
MALVFPARLRATSHALRAGFKGDRFATPEEQRREDAPGR